MHEDELNVFLRASKDKVGVEFLEACLEFLDTKLEIKGMENLPEKERKTKANKVIMNHVKKKKQEKGNFRR